MGLRQLVTILVGVGVAAGLSDPTTTCTVAGVPQFKYETEQLSGTHIPSEFAKLFAFDTKGPGLSHGQCKPLPGDKGWPSQAEWDAFAKALGGSALIRTVPLAAPCYKSWGVYDAGKCASITSNWTSPYFHEEDPTSVMWPVWEGRTCVPTDDPSKSTCTLGAYPVYAVNATSVAHIQLAVNFARSKGLRLVIKNTGHDYQGKSSGAGALSIWTHNLNDISYLANYKLGEFSGNALHVGSGVTTEHMVRLADQHDALVVGGMCATVGFAGGYFAGGGHSPLSSLFGLGADHILAINVVTADGRFVTVTERTQPDLFWALRGGGPSTFGVTTSVVVRLHPKLEVTTSQISFQTSDSVNNETFWLGVRAYFEHFDPMTKAGFYGLAGIRRNSEWYNNSAYSLGVEPMFAPNSSIESFNKVMKPFFDKLTKLGIPYETQPRHFDTFYSAFTDAWPRSQLQVAEPANIEASRLFPKDVWNDAEGFEKAFQAIRRVSDAGYDLTAFAVAPGNPFNVDNAANPALRHNIAFFSTGILLPENPTPAELAATQSKVMNDLVQPWRDAAPASKFGGSYLNEGNAKEPNWQQDFFGSNYPRLLSIKRQWDPAGVFYAVAGVGSEDWEVRTKEQGIQTQNGPLCRL
ncbi:hypothetical protein V8C34DRAFT_310046 [Trichoderma compactum]